MGPKGIAFVISDYSMFEMDGVQILILARERFPVTTRILECYTSQEKYQFSPYVIRAERGGLEKATVNLLIKTHHAGIS